MPNNNFNRNTFSINNKYDEFNNIKEGASKSALFRNEGKYIYIDDYNRTKASKWEYNPNLYSDTINYASSAIASLDTACSSAMSIHVNMVSPEGQDLESKVNQVFFNFAGHVKSACSGINLCSIWATQRYLDGVEAGKCSLRAIDNINVLKDKIKKYTTINNEEIKAKFFNKKGDNIGIQRRINELITIYAKINQGSGKGSINSKGQSMYQQNTFLETISKCWMKLYENGKNIKYGAAGNIIPLDWSAENWKPTSQGSADCSSFVSWVLYEYGYNEFGNCEQHCTWDFTNQANLNRWQSDYGWKVDRAENGGEAAKKVKEGDIVVFDGPESNPNDGHMFIVSKVQEDGKIVTYDAGDQSHWTSLNTQEELRQNNINISDYTGSEEGTTSGYFSSDNPNYNRECIIITIEDVSWDNIVFVNSEIQKYND